MEWHNGDDVLRPPAIGGLFALVNGNFSWVVFNLVDGLYQSGYGKYDFPGNNFRYGYDYGSSIINTAGTTAINAEKWPYAVFQPSNGESQLVLTSEDENEVQEFVLRKGSLVYKVNCKPPIALFAEVRGPADLFLLPKDLISSFEHEQQDSMDGQA